MLKFSGVPLSMLLSGSTRETVNQQEYKTGVLNSHGCALDTEIPANMNMSIGKNKRKCIE